MNIYKLRKVPAAPLPPSPRQNNQSIKLPHVTFLSPSYRGGSVMSYSHHLSIINQFVKPCNFADYVRNLSGIYQNMIIFEEDWFFSQSFRIRKIYIYPCQQQIIIEFEIARLPHSLIIFKVPWSRSRVWNIKLAIASAFLYFTDKRKDI